MAKQSSKVRNEIQNEGRRINTERGGMMDVFNNRLPQAQQRGNDIYNTAMTGYGNVLNRPLNRPDFSGYETMGKNLFNTGGVDPTGQNRMRGSGVFDEFAKTGGLDEAARANIRSRGTATIPAFYQAIRDKLQNQARIGGGAGPGFTASMSRLGRDQGRAAQEAATNTELGLTNQINEGRRWGAGSMSDAESRLQDLMSSNKRFGLSSALGAAEAGGRFDTQNAGLNLDALSGLRGLRSDVPGEEFGLYKMLLDNMSGREGATGGNIGQRMQYDPNVSWFDRLMKIWNQASGNLSNATKLASGGI